MWGQEWEPSIDAAGMGQQIRPFLKDRAWGGCTESPSLRWDGSRGGDVLGGVEQGPHLQGV